MNNVRTVSDAKRDFYTHHTRPINSIYRRVVEELMVEMHLLSVNRDFRYDPIYALGVVTAFEQFMQGYQPQSDKDSIFTALCQAVGEDPQHYKQDAQKLMSMVEGFSSEDWISWLASPTPLEGELDLHNTVGAIASNPKFKYSRLFAIGLYTLLQQTDPELAKDNKRLNKALEQIGEALNLPQEKLQKDIELYRGNLEKMAQALTIVEDAIQVERKKREQRIQDRNKPNQPPTETLPKPENSDTPQKDEAPSSGSS